MRLGLISDLHGNIFALRAALAGLDAVGADRILCAGDIVGYYPFANEVIDLLRSREIECVAGNHDCYLVGRLPASADRLRSYNLDYVDRVIAPAHRRWLEALPSQRTLIIAEQALMVCHGSPWSIEEYIYPDNPSLDRFASVGAKAIVMGHTHIPLELRISGRVLVNPGSCGQPRDYDPRAAYAWLDIEPDSITVTFGRAEYDVASVVARCWAEGFDRSVTDILVRTR